MMPVFTKPGFNTPAFAGDVEGIPSLCVVRVVSTTNSGPIDGLPPNVNTPPNLKYTCLFYGPNGPVQATDVQPVVPREPDTMLVQGFRTDQILLGAVVDGRFMLMNAEKPYYGPCTTGT